MSRDLFNRYIWLVDVIYRSKRITFKEINNKWEKNENISDGKPLPLRTFHNQRNQIEEIFDINIECDKKTNEYYIDNADDMEKGGIRNWLLNTFAVNNLINESHQLKRRILFEEIPSSRQYLTSIIEAMRDNLIINITYKGFYKNKETTFEVEPYFVKVFRGRWYLVARSILEDKIRTYALDRMIDLFATDKTFIYPKDFNPQAYFRYCFGIIQDNETKEQTIKIKVFNNQDKYISSLPLHHSQQEVEKTDSYTVFSYYLSPTFDFIRELLSYGDNIEILSPTSLRDCFANISKNMNKIYNNKKIK